MATPLPHYAELHCLSNYSFQRGASSPAELVTRAAALGYGAIAVTDECSLAGVVRAHVAAKAANIALVIGAEFRLDSGEVLVLLACDRNGYGNLCELITHARRRSSKGQYRVSREDFDTGIAGCLALYVPKLGTDASIDLDALAWIGHRFEGRTWIAAELHSGPDDRNLVSRLRDLSARSALPLTACGDVHMHLRSRRRLQDLLVAVRLGRPIAECGHALFPNAERHLRHRLRLANVYPAAWLEESIRIASLCHFSLDELRYEYPEEVVPSGETPASYLRKETEAGLRIRYPLGTPPKVSQQIEHELALIAEKSYESYFLTVYDIVRYARAENILCQGRGSAANSAVCYALGITEVDPARGNLLFERFISRERDEPPDIDIDFEHERREEVIQYIYRRYGRERTAIAATVITYRLKSALRDVGKALGLEAAQLQALTQSLAWWDDRARMPERLRELGMDPDSPQIQRLLEMVATILSFPRHLSQHVGGFVISRGPLSRLVPIENAAMPERTVIQWEKDDLEAVGLMKVDVLALGMLTAIRRALQLLNQFHGTQLRMQDIPAEDPAVFQMIQRADTVGVFQIESRAQMSMLPRLKPACYYDLVIEVAIVRPGPIQGGMVHPYLRRRQGKEPVSYPSKAVQAVLERTLGVPIFQEQVMQIAMAAAGFTPGEADQLRRAMAAWKRKGGLEPFEAKLKSGMAARGYAPEFAERIFQQILGFGDYGFPESHSASFALLAYVSAWLKRHHPAAFLAALLNSQPMGFYAPAQLTQDARRHGVEIFPVTVNESQWENTLERDAKGEPGVRLGLVMIKGLPRAAADRITEARRAGVFPSVHELAHRARLTRQELSILAAANALREIENNRRDALWSVAGIDDGTALLPRSATNEPSVAFQAPSEGKDLAADYRSLGFTLGRHPLALLRGQLTRQRVLSATAIQALAHQSTAVAGGLVVGRQRPDTASGVIFVTLEDETGCVNVVVWRTLAERQRRELLGARLLMVRGIVECVDGVTHLIAKQLFDRSALLGDLATRSRDFH